MGGPSYRAVPSGDERPGAFLSPFPVPLNSLSPPGCSRALCPWVPAALVLCLHQGRHSSSKVPSAWGPLPCHRLPSAFQFWPPAGRSHGRQDVGSTCPEQPLQCHRQSNMGCGSLEEPDLEHVGQRPPRGPVTQRPEGGSRGVSAPVLRPATS